MKTFKLSYLFYALLFVLLSACDSTPKTEQIKNLNGYWEIAEVKQKNGQVKQYKFNETVDYIQLDENYVGYRKKMSPMLNGSYRTTPASEELEVKIEDDSIRFYYSTGRFEWKETLLSSEENSFTVKNKYGNIFTYKRFNGYLDHGKE